MLKFVAIFWEQTIVTGFFPHVTSFFPLLLISGGNWGGFCLLITDLKVLTPGFLWAKWSVVWVLCFEEALQCHSSHKRIASVHMCWWCSCSEKAVRFHQAVESVAQAMVSCSPLMSVRCLPFLWGWCCHPPQGLLMHNMVLIKKKKYSYLYTF